MRKRNSRPKVTELNGRGLNSIEDELTGSFVQNNKSPRMFYGSFLGDRSKVHNTRLRAMLTGSERQRGSSGED
jgi:ribulose kinase